MSLEYTYCLGSIAKVLRSGIMAKGKPVTPSAIDKAAESGAGKSYAGKYVFLMRKFYGFTITEVKDKRTIVSYTVTDEPSNLAELTAFTGGRKAKVSKTVKTPVKLTIAEENRRIKAAETKPKSKPTAKAAAKKVKKDKPVFDMGKDEVERQFGSSGEVATSFSVDPDWDNFDDSDIPVFLK